jgi:hypothetical protein
MQRKRRLIEPVFYKRPYCWDMVDQNELKDMRKVENDPLNPKFFSYHDCINLNH